MRCKVGDLAVIVNTLPPHRRHVGRIVRVVAWNEPYQEWDLDIRDGGLIVCIADDHLRPIRDNDGTDETLTWREAPKTVERHREALRDLIKESS